MIEFFIIRIFYRGIEGNGPDMQMTKENRLLVLIALVTSMMMVGLAMVMRGPTLLKAIVDFPGGWKIFLNCILLGFMTALVSAFAYDVSCWIRKILPVDVLLIVRGLPVLLWILVAVMGSCAEEIFFRGALQPLVGIIPTNVIFGFMHFFWPATTAPVISLSLFRRTNMNDTNRMIIVITNSFLFMSIFLCWLFKYFMEKFL